MVLKITVMPHICWIQRTKAILQYPFEFCSGLSFIGNIFSRHWYLFCACFSNSDFTFVFLLLSLSVSVQPDLSKIFPSYHEWKLLFTQKCATNYQTCLEDQLNNFWARKKSMLMKYHTDDFAEWMRIIWTHFGVRCLVFWDILQKKSFRRQCFYRIITITWNGRY